MTALGPTIVSARNELPAGIEIIDAYTPSIQELFFIEHPQLKKGMPGVNEQIAAYQAGATEPHAYIYYPWQRVAVDCVSEATYLRLRTARNRNIITEDEQKAYRALSVGIVGLSVGSAIVASLTISGGPQRIKIADFDVLEVSNLNRLRGNLLSVGMNKAIISAQLVWELDPFAHLEVWDTGVTKETLADFVSNPRLDVAVDEMDQIDMKIRLRHLCREHRIPVVMATDNGDGVIIDIERYDLDSKYPIFHGLIDDIEVDLDKPIDFPTWLKLATHIVDPSYLTERMQHSLAQIGKEIAAVPQLGTSAAVAGTAVSFVLRRIATGADMPSGRYRISLEDTLIPDYTSAESTAKRQRATETFKTAFYKHE